ncbi:MAG: T9SS type A sorting domain-containing protein [Chitinophagales bacterium]
MKRKLKVYSGMAAVALLQAGTANTQVVYTDIDPDHFYNNECDPFPDGHYVCGNVFGPEFSASLDFDGDGNMETFKIDHELRYPDEYYAECIVNLYFKDNDMQLLFAYTSGHDVVMPLNYGSNINAVLNFDGFEYGSNTRLVYINATYTATEWDEYLIWYNLEDKFIAVRKQVGPDYYYGWIRLNLLLDDDVYLYPLLNNNWIEDVRLTIKDHAFNLTPNDPIYAGEGLNDCSLSPTITAMLPTSPTSEKLKWTFMPNAEFYQIWYRTVGDPTWTKKKSLATTKIISGLTCETEYEFKIRGKCDGVFSPFSKKEYFTTADCKLGETHVNEITALLFPNPASQTLNIDLGNTTGNVVIISIKDIQGNQIRDIEFSAADDGILELDISSLPKGIYFLNIICDGRQVAEKFVVQ